VETEGFRLGAPPPDNDPRLIGRPFRRGDGVSTDVECLSTRGAKDSIRRLHDRAALKVTRSSSSCANVSVIPPSMPSMARARASFEG
jgi:hypothetical protein